MKNGFIQSWPLIFLPVAVVLFFFFWLQFSSFDELYIQQTETELLGRARLLAYAARPLIEAGRMDEVQKLCRDEGGAVKSRITVIDANGKVLADSEEEPTQMDNHALRPEILGALEAFRNGKTSSPIVRFSSTQGQRLIYCAYPVRIGNALYIFRSAFSIHQIDRVLSRMRMDIIFAVLLTALVAGGLSYIIFRTVSRRLEHWGYNSIGDSEDFRLIALGKTPYTKQHPDYDWKMPRVGTSNLKFYDVYDPRYVAKMRTLIPDLAEKHPEVLRSLTDPMCIGYFIDNELNIGNRQPLELNRAVLGSPEKQCIKREFIGDLKRKYHTVHKLNKAWNTSYASWSALQRSTEVPEKQTEAYRADGKAVLEKTIDRYFAICRDSIKSVAPHRLYLGCRFISTDSVIPELSAASQ